jgi:hypothetical protein
MAATVQAPVASLERFTVPAAKWLDWAEEVALKSPKVALRASTATAAMAAAEPAARASRLLVDLLLCRGVAVTVRSLSD